MVREWIITFAEMVRMKTFFTHRHSGQAQREPESSAVSP
jgi:hypothetical protein